MSGRRLLLIGIGAGHPDWITLQAVRAIESLDVLFVVVKEDEYDDLVRARLDLIARFRETAPRVVELQDPPRPWQQVPDYPAAVAAWRAHREESWDAAVAGALGPGEVGGFLVWGDPGLYESTLAVAHRLVARAAEAGRPLALAVYPGVASPFALCAAHKIPANRQGKAVQIMPARLLRDGMPDGVDDALVMLDGRQTFAAIDPAGLDVYWGAFLGTEDELLISGDLATVRDEILAARADALARKGWMFDTYLLRRR